jgi:hypothetical protein
VDIALDEQRTVTSYLRYLIFSTGVFSLIFSCTALATTFVQQAIIRMITGLLQSIITPISMSVINYYFDSASGPEGDGSGLRTPVLMKASALGVFNYGVYLAFSLSLSLGTWVYDEFGWRTSYVLFGLCGLAFSVLAPCLVDIRAPIRTLAAVEARVESPVVAAAGYESVEMGSPMGGGAAAVAGRTYGWRVYLANSRRILGSILSHWSHSCPVVCLLLVLAAGLRSGAGYIWVTYMAVYFSEMFAASSDSCLYSYNAAYQPASGAGVPSVCGSSHPYCIDGTCNALFSTPWHNRGISHEALEEYMWWVPLVGSAMGCLCGGMLSDALIAMGDGSTYDSSAGDDVSRKLLRNGRDDSSDDSGAGGRVAPRGVLACLRSVLCGGTGGRALVAGVGVLLALPFVYLALVDSQTTPVPVCFFMLILSGFVSWLCTFCC